MRMPFLLALWSCTCCPVSASGAVGTEPLDPASNDVGAEVADQIHPEFTDRIHPESF